MLRTRTHTRTLALAILLPSLALTLAACSPPIGSGDAPASPAVSSVLGQGTVLQVEDAAPQFCLGAVAESYPPQCSGPELVGWDWNEVEGSETASGVTWGTYAVWGTWNGTSLTVTDSIMLALYDPMFVADPYLDEANRGPTGDDELAAIQQQVADEAPVEVLASWAENGYLFAQVTFDDGSVQEWADSTFGPDVVLIRPALVVV